MPLILCDKSRVLMHLEGQACTGSAMRRLLEPYLLQRWERMHRQGVDRVLGYPRSHAYKRPKVHDRGIHDALHRELLNAMQEGFAFGFVALDGLLLEEFVNVR